MKPDITHIEDCDCEDCLAPKPGHDWHCETAEHGWSICACAERAELT